MPYAYTWSSLFILAKLSLLPAFLFDARVVCLSTVWTMEASTIPSLFSSLQIPNNHTSVGLSNLVASNSACKALFHHKRLPDVGWTDVAIQRLLFELSVLDTNCEETVKCQLSSSSSSSSSGGSNGEFAHRWTGAGEREGRIYSPLVSQRHYGFGHGIGRSGDVMEAQPKAVGSSALLRLTLRLALDAVRRGAGRRERAAPRPAVEGDPGRPRHRRRRRPRPGQNVELHNVADGDVVFQRGRHDVLCDWRRQ